MAKRVLITGASRGIGLELVKHYKALGWNVVAAVRNPSSATELRSLGPEGIVALDVADEASVATAATAIGADAPIDMLINNAGIIVKSSLTKTTKADFLRQLEVNAVGPFLVTKAFMPNLKLAAKQNDYAIAAFLSAKIASIELNTQGGYHAYRASKTALNGIAKTLAVDMAPRGISTVLLHPGYVKTDFTGHKGDLTAEESARALASILDNVRKGDKAAFYDIDGTILPW
ncbi:hypothetical protein SDRG_04006 [Saprolegnia diclina VS20]|uniref:Short-chain dehydrogenase n=1 Tax=Saprolegnia diclina (strain VS20) TaxID=1156394 RepID=T0QW62_SAPDV|nr:hypothetical protein SDRG_04006 [Saprolegnia diclina VS20]EQC38285.1 hypothetical protein SDRG_04006 [Saprolegnia diclina VS20]|eukprot:XP_008607877.1 hypothetical protein SDRG_04006 [Saprolegnia diclina VS20]